MKTTTTIWAEKEDDIGVEIESYSDGERYVRLNFRDVDMGLGSLSIYLTVDQAQDLQVELLNIALGKKNLKKEDKKDEK